MIEKIIAKMEAEKCELADYKEGSEHRRLAQQWNNCIDECKKIVQEVAKEYGNASDNDLTVVSALPSLYPLQPFEEEAIHKVVASAKEYKESPVVKENLTTEKDGGWIPVKVAVPNEGEKVLTTDRYNNYHIFKFVENVFVDEGGRRINKNHPRYFPPVAWQRIAPYQKGE